MQDYQSYLTWISTLHKEMALILEARISGFFIKRFPVNGQAWAALSRSPGAKSHQLFMVREFFLVVTHKESVSLRKAFLDLNASKMQMPASPGVVVLFQEVKVMMASFLGQQSAKLFPSWISFDSFNTLKQMQCYYYPHFADDQTEALGN